MDNALVHKLWQGDLTALGMLYDRYASLVYSIALKALRSVSEAEDLTQEVFMILARWQSASEGGPRAYDPQRGSLAKYLTTLTRSRAIDRLRSRTTYRKYLDRWSHTQTAMDLATPLSDATKQERRALVVAALSTLKSKQREVLELSYYEGRSQKEISEQLGVPLGTVKSWARRGLLQLREKLRDQLGDEPQ